SPRFLERSKHEGDADGSESERPSESTRSLPLAGQRPARPPPPPPGPNRASETIRPLSGPPSTLPPTPPGQRPVSGAVGSPNLALLAAAAANRRNSQRGEALAEQLK